MMYSRDALKTRDYEQDDFRRPTNQPLPPRDPDVLMGADAEWVDKYADFFESGEPEDRMKSVVIPKYEGPKNTRLDIYTLSDQDRQTVDINGIPNHAQPTTLFLKQTFTIKTRQWITHMRSILAHRPFTLQRQFRSITWNCPQASEQFEIDTQVHCRLAPFICDAQMIKNCCQTKYSFIMKRMPTNPVADANDAPQDNDPLMQASLNYAYLNVNDLLTVEDEITTTITIMEPLLGFQQGYARLDAVRPMNQGNNIYPLAIQDYSLHFDRYPKKDRYKRILRDNRQPTDYSSSNSNTNGYLGTEGAGRDVQNGIYNTNLQIFEKSSDPVQLVSFSDDSAIQENKNVSSIDMHCPFFVKFSNKVKINPYLEDHDEHRHGSVLLTYSHHTFLPPVDYTDVSVPIVLGIDDGTEACKIRCTTSKGYPSYIMIYLEDFGRDYFDPTFTDSAVNNIGTDMYIGGHPTIHEMDIKVFGQSFPIVKNLTNTELDYLTKKNSHPKCDFDENMKYDPIVLLKLEDLGLGTELQGYPNAKRIEMEVDIRQIKLPHNYIDRFKQPDMPLPNIDARVVFIYENYVLEGNNGQCKFVWKYL